MSQITRRLVAAGASPARARAFAEQFAKSQPGVKTQDLEDAFDEQLAELSKAAFPNVFRPPTLDDPRINDYVAFVYGPNKFAEIESQVSAKNAPMYNKALNSSIAYEQKIAKAIKSGLSVAQIQDAIVKDYDASNADILAFPIVQTFKDEDASRSDVLGGVNKYLSDLYNDYVKIQPALTEAKAKFLAADKTYAAGLPSPKLKYGKEENLAKGLISWKSHPEVEKALAKIPARTPATRLTSQLPSQPSSMGLYDKANPEDALFREFSSSKANPLRDEISRREFLKDKTTR